MVKENGAVASLIWTRKYQNFNDNLIHPFEQPEIQIVDKKYKWGQNQLYEF